MSHNETQSIPNFTEHYCLGLGFHGFHRIHYLEWGDKNTTENQETLICVHGITRNSRDFDYLASQLCHQYRIICPDVVGRGDSDHLAAADGYNYLQYNSDMNALLARVDTEKVNWIGTSMGGIIGMVLASMSQSPIQRLVINDIGPEVSRDALLSIADNFSPQQDWGSVDEIEQYLRKIYHEFAPMTDEDWKQIAEHSSRRTKQGKWRLKFDEGIGEAFRESIPYLNVDMWDTWEKIRCPVLLLRGKNSSFLTEGIAKKMLATGPETTLIEFDDTGHTPTLRNDEQVTIISEWLKKN